MASHDPCGTYATQNKFETLKDWFIDVAQFTKKHMTEKGHDFDISVDDSNAEDVIVTFAQGPMSGDIKSLTVHFYKTKGNIKISQQQKTPEKNKNLFHLYDSNTIIKKGLSSFIKSFKCALMNMTNISEDEAISLIDRVTPEQRETVLATNLSRILNPF